MARPERRTKQEERILVLNRTQIETLWRLNATTTPETFPEVCQAGIAALREVLMRERSLGSLDGKYRLGAVTVERVLVGDIQRSVSKTCSDALALNAVVHTLSLVPERVNIAGVLDLLRTVLAWAELVCRHPNDDGRIAGCPIADLRFACEYLQS